MLLSFRNCAAVPIKTNSNWMIVLSKVKSNPHINSWNDFAICLTSSAQHTGFHWISLDQAFVEQEAAWGDLRSFERHEELGCRGL